MSDKDQFRGKDADPGQHAGEREEVFDNLTAALARLRAAADRLREEAEANAQAEWVRTKPELRQTIADLEAMVDALAQRAKSALGDLGSRLDGQPSRDGN